MSIPARWGTVTVFPARAHGLGCVICHRSTWPWLRGGADCNVRDEREVPREGVEWQQPDLGRGRVGLVERSLHAACKVHVGRYRTVHRYRIISSDAESVRNLNVVQNQRAQAVCLGNKEEMEVEPCRRNCLAEIGTLGYAHGNLCSAYPTRCCVRRSMEETILCAYAGRQGNTPQWSSGS